MSSSTDTKLVETVATLFDAIKHGDRVHQAWLKEAIDNHFAGKPVPPPRAALTAIQSEGSGSSELVEFFRGDGHKFGHTGDYEGWTPARSDDCRGWTAVRRNVAELEPETMTPNPEQQAMSYQDCLQREIGNIAELLAGGAGLWYTSDSVELVTRHRFDHTAFNYMLHHGWLESTAGCGGYRLTDEGLRAYLRSTDEMGDGKLIDPSPEYRP